MSSREPHLYVCAIQQVVYHLTVHPPSSRCVDTWVIIDGARRLGSVPCSPDGVLAWPAGLSATFRVHVEEALADAIEAWSS